MTSLDVKEMEVKEKENKEKQNILETKETNITNNNDNNDNHQNTPTEKYNLKVATKTGSGMHEELTSRMFKVISKPIGHLIIKYTNFSPNQVTVASYFALLLSVIFFIWTPFSSHPYTYRLLAAFFAVLLYLLDDIDGMIARAKAQTSVLGKWLDCMVGYVFPSALFFGLAFSLQDYKWLLVGSIAMIVFPVQYTIIYAFKHDFMPLLKQEEFLGISKDNPRRYIYGSATIYPVIFFSCLFNVPWFALLFYATFGNLFWIGILIMQYRSVKKFAKDAK